VELDDGAKLDAMTRRSPTVHGPRLCAVRVRAQGMRCGRHETRAMRGTRHEARAEAQGAGARPVRLDGRSVESIIKIKSIFSIILSQIIFKLD
jgi:hypothetical protein